MVHQKNLQRTAPYFGACWPAIWGQSLANFLGEPLFQVFSYKKWTLVDKQKFQTVKRASGTNRDKSLHKMCRSVPEIRNSIVFKHVNQKYKSHLTADLQNVFVYPFSSLNINTGTFQSCTLDCLINIHTIINVRLLHRTFLGITYRPGQPNADSTKNVLSSKNPQF